MMRSVLLMLCLTTTLGACGNAGRGGNFCDIAKPIYFQPDDQVTRATERAIITHNQVGEALCRWR